MAMTHLAIEDDRLLAGALPQISLIMGGHEHLNNLEHIGSTIIAKADANAKSVYIHKLVFDINNKLVEIKSELVNVDSQVREDAKAIELVDMWVDRAYAGFRSKGFEPGELVGVANVPLDGRDESIRYMPTNLGELIASAMLAVSKNSEFAILNSGSVRIDDEVKGEITQYDIIRMLPFGGKIIEVELKGSLLLKLLETGVADSGSGGYLQYAGLRHSREGGKWIYGNDETNIVTPQGTYRVSVAAYLLTGLEQNMQFFTKDNPEIIKITEPDANDNNDLRNDVRRALIQYMKNGGLK
jgi:2',3'-cyclic-nucleotide 2'-phosphodiesterase (5'-nucleotidase family)